LCGPYESSDGQCINHDLADSKCGHCGVEIRWDKTWVPEYKNEYDKGDRW